MDEAGNHHSQQTKTGTGNQTPHVLTHNWEFNNENTWTQEGKYHIPGPVGEWGDKRGLALGEIPNVGEGEKKRKHTAMCVPTQLSCMLCSCTPKPIIQ